MQNTIWNKTNNGVNSIGKKIAFAGALGIMGVGALAGVSTSSAHASANHAGESYQIAWGDTLSGIAAKYGTSVDALVAENGLVNVDLIYAGDTLYIPSAGAAASVETSVPAQTEQAPVQQQQVEAPVQQQAEAPVQQTYADSSIEGMIRSTFGANADYALHIAACESSMNPNAYNGILGAAGLFQIIPGTWASTSQAGQSPYNAAANIQAAYEIFHRDGNSWMEWECK